MVSAVYVIEDGTDTAADALEDEYHQDELIQSALHLADIAFVLCRVHHYLRVVARVADQPDHILSIL